MWIRTEVSLEYILSSKRYLIFFRAVALGYQAIRNGDCTLLVAGGQESMSRAQHSTYLRSSKLGALNLCDTLLSDGLTDAFNNIHMGNTGMYWHKYCFISFKSEPIFLAEHLAKKYDISREAQDKYAVNSQSKAVEAIKSGFFDKEIVGVPDKRTKALILTDEFPKPDCILEKISKLRPAFDQVSFN